MAVTCGTCRFCKEIPAEGKIILSEPNTGAILLAKQIDTTRVRVCKPLPSDVSCFPHRNQVVSYFHSCSLGENE